MLGLNKPIYMKKHQPMVILEEHLKMTDHFHGKN